MGQPDPTPITDIQKARAASEKFDKSFILSYAANAVLWILFVLSLVSDFVLTNQQITGAWLGFSEIQWHWATFILGAAAFVYNGLTHAPPLTAWPHSGTLDTEAQVHEIRKAA